MISKFLGVIVSANFLLANSHATPHSQTLEARSEAFDDYRARLSNHELFKNLNDDIKDGKKPFYGAKEADYIACYTVKEGKYTYSVHPDLNRVNSVVDENAEFPGDAEKGKYFGKQIAQVVEKLFNSSSKKKVSYELGTKKEALVKKLDGNAFCALVVDSGEKVSDYESEDNIR
jgi:hypothetical protein